MAEDSHQDCWVVARLRAAKATIVGLNKGLFGTGLT